MPFRLHPIVLVIDAQPLQSNQLRMLLEQIGAQVEYAHGGLDGLALVEALVPDIVLLDMTLPDGEAYTVCRTIRKLAQVQTVPVLALLEREVKQVIERAYDAGVTDCLSKSVCGTILRRRVRHMLDGRRCLHALAMREAYLNKAQSIAAVGSWHWDVFEHEIQFSDEMRRLYGMRGNLPEANVEALLGPVHAEDRPLVELALQNALQIGVPYEVEYRVRGGDGVPRFIQGKCEVAMTPSRQPLHLYGTVQDITERKQQEVRLLRTAMYDLLTDVPNRNLLADRVTQAITQAQRSGQRIVMACLDLDGFKFINSSFGYAAGDTLLRKVAIRLMEAVRECDTVARLGGGEFVVVLHSVSPAAPVGALMKKILNLFSAPFAVDEQELHTTACIGVSVYPQDSNSCDGLLRCADAALHTAKGRGHDSMEFYTHKMGIEAERHLMLENALRAALQHGEFELNYQPKVALPGGQVFGVEALIRWRRPGHDVVSPGEFIPLAEATGIIVPIGEWVLRTACGQLRRWHDMGLTTLTMAVNLSPRQFVRQDIPALIRRVLADSQVPAKSLELELTESILMSEGAAVAEALLQLKEIGVSLALDDFGTGYSSLSYLKRFPIDVLKIDRSFIKDLASDAEDASLTRTIILMAQSLHMKTVAEGVENMAQLNFLRRCRCDAIQGYFFSKPLDAYSMSQLLAERRSLPAEAGIPYQHQTLLLLHSDPQVISTLIHLLRGEEYQILCATTPAQAFELLVAYSVHVVLCATSLPTMAGADILERVKKMCPETIRILLAEHRDLDAVLDAINRGTVYRFFSKPWEEGRLRDQLRDAFRHQLALYGRALPIAGEGSDDGGDELLGDRPIVHYIPASNDS